MAKSRAKRFARIKRKADNLSTLMRLVVLGGSGYLLWRRYQKEMDQERVEAAQMAQQARAAGGSPSAMQPLVGPSAQPIASQQPRVLQYGGASPDQVRTTQLLPTTQAVPLDP